MNMVQCLGTLLIKTNYGSEAVIPLYITSCREKIYSECAVVALLFTQHLEFAVYGIKHHIIANWEVNKEMKVVTQKIHFKHIPIEYQQVITTVLLRKAVH